VAGDVTSGGRARTEGKPGRRVLIVGGGRPTMTVRSMSGDVSLAEPNAVIRPDAPPAPIRPFTPEEPSMPPEPPLPPEIARPDVAPDDSPTVVADAVEPDADAEARLTILRALERGEIDVAEAGRRLEALDGGSADA
jgi:hypothetical protein